MITPADFRDRFGRAPDRSGEPFVAFDRDMLVDAGVNVRAANYLAEAGLPRHVEFLGEFSAMDADTISLWHGAGLPPDYHPIGSNGAVNFLVIAKDSGAVRSISSDWKRASLLNSSVAHLAESLCLFAECADASKWPEFVQRIAGIDPPAADAGSVWRELADDLASFA